MTEKPTPKKFCRVKSDTDDKKLPNNIHENDEELHTVYEFIIAQNKGFFCDQRFQIVGVLGSAFPFDRNSILVRQAHVD